MDLLSPIRGLKRLIAAWRSPVHPLDVSRAFAARHLAMPGRLPGSRIDYATEAGSLDLNSVVAAAIGWATDSIGQADFLVNRAAADQTEEPQWGHPLMELVSNPGQDFTDSDLFGTALRDLIVDGNAYWHLIRSGSDEVVEIEPVDCWRVEPWWPEKSQERIVLYKVNLDHRIADVEPKDMIHFRMGRDSTNDRKGVSRLRAGLRSICGMNEADTYLFALLKNGCQPGVVFSVENPEEHDLDDNQIAALKDSANEKVGDARFKAVVSSIPLKGQQFGFSPEQMALTSIPDRFESTICALIGFSPVVLGLKSAAEHAAYANTERHTRNSWERLQGYLSNIAKTLSRTLLPEFEEDDRYSCGWNYDRVSGLREAMDALATRSVLLFEKGVTKRNESRELVGLDKDDESGDGEKYWNEIQADLAAASQPESPFGEPGGEAKEGEAEDESDSEEVPAVRRNGKALANGHAHRDPWSRN
jgi:HK97 family phage portal protein